MTIIGTPLIPNKGCKKGYDVKPCEITDPKMLGIVSKIIDNGYRVRASIFTFKFNTRGESVDFCVKHDIPLEREWHDQLAQIWFPNRGDSYINEDLEVMRWKKWT